MCAGWSLAAPGFSLHLPNGTRILVETMQGDSAYLVDKAAQHDAMRCLPNVVALMTHTPGGDDAGFRRALTHLVMQERHSKAV